MSLLSHLKVATGLFVSRESLASVCAFLDGFDLGRHRAPLLGFREWLVVRQGGGDNMGWIGLVHQFLTASDSEQCRIVALCTLIEDFLNYRREQGLTKVYYEYGKWLMRQSWYEGPLRRRPG